MRKITTTFGLVCLVIGLLWFGVRMISPEDTWLCVNGQWVKHGQPKDPPPTSGCEAQSSPSSTLGEETTTPSGGEAEPQSTPTSLANPASVNCLAVGGKVELESSPAGVKVFCLFPDGSECEEWALQRKECAAGQYKPQLWQGQIKTYPPEAPYRFFLETLEGERFSLTSNDKLNLLSLDELQPLADQDLSVTLTGYPDHEMPGAILVKKVDKAE